MASGRFFVDNRHEQIVLDLNYSVRCGVIAAAPIECELNLTQILCHFATRSHRHSLTSPHAPPSHISDFSLASSYGDHCLLCAGLYALQFDRLTIITISTIASIGVLDSSFLFSNEWDRSALFGARVSHVVESTVLRTTEEIGNSITVKVDSCGTGGVPLDILFDQWSTIFEPPDSILATCLQQQVSVR
jgi:hypothetical protein